MKKYIGFFAVCLLAQSALAEWGANCTNNGGTIITANSYGNDKSGGLCHDPSDSNVTQNCNGKIFCESNEAMNWWSAFTWCEAIGGRLASFESMCPGIIRTPNDTIGACPNLKATGVRNDGDDWGWSNFGWGTTDALVVKLTTGNIRAYGGRRYTIYHAFCEE